LSSLTRGRPVLMLIGNLAAPKILLHEGTTGTVRIEGTVMLQIEATVTPVK
jgi:hypothetical protein